jgi:hypothetical protein
VDRFTKRQRGTRQAGGRRAARGRHAGGGSWPALPSTDSFPPALRGFFCAAPPAVSASSRLRRLLASPPAAASSEFSARSSSDAALPLAPIAVDIRGQILTLHVHVTVFFYKKKSTNKILRVIQKTK